jgi:hypothetical protein
LKFLRWFDLTYVVLLADKLYPKDQERRITELFVRNLCHQLLCSSQLDPSAGLEALLPMSLSLCFSSWNLNHDQASGNTSVHANVFHSTPASVLFLGLQNALMAQSSFVPTVQI